MDRLVDFSDNPANLKVTMSVNAFHCSLAQLCHAILQGAQDALKTAGYPEVFLGGNYMSGVALGKCVEYGYTEAARLSDFLSQSAASNTNSPDKAQDEAFYGSVV